jgi:hypothetical protein
MWTYGAKERIVYISRVDSRPSQEGTSVQQVARPSHIPEYGNIRSYRCENIKYYIKKIPWSESASELYRPSDRRLSAKLVPTFADRRCRVVSVTDPYDRILGFLDRSRYFSIK